MNFYQRHIGDYLKATTHFTLLEHGIYSRLLDVYYTKEGPIPADQAARLVGARTGPEKAALQSVLSEFFTESPEGWRQKRCDAEIALYNEGAEEREHRLANEAERVRRHRERRKEMFATLRERGIVPKWDATTTELERLLNVPVTDLKRVQVPDSNAPVTANHTHTQEPINKDKPPPASRSASKKTPMPADFGISDRVRQWAAENKHGQLDKHLAAFRISCQAKGYAYVDWDAAFMNAIRGNWAKLEATPQQVAATRKPDRYELANIEFERKEAEFAARKLAAKLTGEVGVSAPSPA